MKERSEQQLNFEEKKRNFFIKLGLRAKEWLKMHKELGRLWEGKKTERWENVSEHCLVEAARADMLSDLLKISPNIKKQLFAAAILHDFNKKQETLDTTAKGSTVESFEEIYDISTQKLTEAGVDKSIIEISDSVAWTATNEMEKIIKKTEPTDDEIARLIMHYVDDYTMGSAWAKPYDGQKNDFDRRMDTNDANTKYAKLTEAGLHAEQRRVGYLVEQKLSELIKQRSSVEIEPKMLPEEIDRAIRENIEKQI